MKSVEDFVGEMGNLPTGTGKTLGARLVAMNGVYWEASRPFT